MIGYIVEEYSTRYPPGWQQLTRQPVEGCDMDIKDFDIGEEVEFRVLAVNAAGYGQPCLGTDVVTIKDPLGE